MTNSNILKKEPHFLSDCSKEKKKKNRSTGTILPTSSSTNIPMHNIILYAIGTDIFYNV